MLLGCSTYSTDSEGSNVHVQVMISWNRVEDGGEGKHFYTDLNVRIIKDYADNYLLREYPTMT